MKRILFIAAIIAVIAAAIWATMAWNSSQISGNSQGSPVFQQGDMSAIATSSSSADGFYADPSGFSFMAPEGLTATAVQEPGAETIMVGKTQIYVTAYDEKASAFGAARIRRDLPALAMRNVREFAIGDGRGVEFDDPTGHQIWFAASGQLFQITSPADQARVADKIVTSFKFQ